MSRVKETGSESERIRMKFIPNVVKMEEKIKIMKRLEGRGVIDGEALI